MMPCECCGLHVLTQGHDEHGQPYKVTTVGMTIIGGMLAGMTTKAVLCNHCADVLGKQVLTIPRCGHAYVEPPQVKMPPAPSDPRMFGKGGW